MHDSEFNFNLYTTYKVSQYNYVTEVYKMKTIYFDDFKPI